MRLPSMFATDLVMKAMGLVAISGLVFAFYSWSRAQGFEAGQANALETIGGRIVQLEKERDDVRKELFALRDEYDQHKKDTAEYILQYQTTTARILKDLEDTSKRQVATRLRVEQELKDAKKWISDEDNRKCALPAGAVSLHNLSANPPGESATLGPPGNADTPGEPTLRDYAETVRDNYATCYYWRDQVVLWQSWHSKWDVWHKEYVRLNPPK